MNKTTLGILLFVVVVIVGILLLSKDKAPTEVPQVVPETQVIVTPVEPEIAPVATSVTPVAPAQ